MFPGIRIFQVTGECNAAIGRNVGAKESSGETLFFIDGDMEIQPDFLPIVFNNTNGLLYDFVSGQFVDYNYSFDNVYLNKTEYYQSDADKIEFTTGGLFFIKRDLWQNVQGMKNKLRRSEDIDFALRLAKNGVYLTRKKEQLAIHHTVPYYNTKRMWSMLFDGSEFYRSVLLRENLFNKYQWKLFLRENYTCIILLAAILYYLLVGSALFAVIYIIAITTRVMQKKVMYLQKLNLFIYFLIRDLITWPALFFFFPSNKNQYSYKRL